MPSLGMISFQSNTKKDVFYTAYVATADTVPVDTQIEKVEHGVLNAYHPAISGKKARMEDVNVEGDTGEVTGCFRGTAYPGAFTITIYLEYEEVEEFVKPEETV